MCTIDSEIVSGSDLPEKGRIPLTKSLSFIAHNYIESPIVYKNPNKTNSSTLDFMPDDILLGSLKLLIRDHYAPFTGWIEMEDTDIYLAWDNYKDGVYLPAFPIQFETTTIDTDYGTFCKIAHRNDPILRHSKAPCQTDLNDDKQPLIFFKIARLGPNSQAVAINITFNHMIMDVCSLTKFYLNWTTLFRQMLKDPELQSLPEGKTYEIPHPPLFGVPDFSKFRIPDDSNYKEQVKDNIENAANISTILQNLMEFDEHNLAISVNKQQEIREKAHSSGVSFQVYLFAIILKECIMAQSYKKPDIVNNTATFDIVMNARSKLGISENFCSSVVAQCDIKIKVSDIQEMSTIKLAQKIKEKLNSTGSPEGICGFLDKHVSIWKRVCQRDGDFLTNFRTEYMKRIIDEPTFLVDSMLNFKMDNIDFGSGEPAAVCLPRLFSNGIILVKPLGSSVHDNCNIRLSISLPKWCDISKSSVLSEMAVSC